MGYSHRWKIEEDMTVQEFKHLQGIAAKIVEASDAPVEFSTKTHPLHLFIMIEGINEGAHETFYLTPKAVEFDCCKTARKPYDEIVVGILDYADALGLLKFTSDGNPDDLAAGRKLASAHYEEQDKDEWVPNLRWAHEEAHAEQDEEIDKDEWCLTVTVTEECLTCETEVINGGTWGYCDECWDERVRWLGQEEGE